MPRYIQFEVWRRSSLPVSRHTICGRSEDAQGLYFAGGPRRRHSSGTNSPGWGVPWSLPLTANGKLVRRVHRRHTDVPRGDLAHLHGQWTVKSGCLPVAGVRGSRRHFITSSALRNPLSFARPTEICVPWTSFSVHICKCQGTHPSPIPPHTERARVFGSI